AALASNYYLSDDQYGAVNQLSIQGTTLPLADAAVGRLVENSADITAAINSFLSPGGSTLAANSSFSSGYSFMATPAQQVSRAFSTGGIPAGSNAQLINDSWTASQLTNALTSAHPNLVFLGAH